MVIETDDAISAESLRAVLPKLNSSNRLCEGLQCVKIRARRRWFLFGPWVVKAKYRVIQ